MKFSVKVTNFGRVGSISDLPKPWCHQTFPTPSFFTHTLSGSVPHLTHNSLQKINASNLFMLQTLPSVAEYKEILEDHDKGLGHFVGLSEYPFHLSVQDPGVITPSGGNVSKSVSIWGEAGRRQVTVTDYMKMIQIFKPASYQALSDGDTDQNSSKKRLSKSVDHTLKYLDGCLADHELLDLKNTAVFGSVEGGYDLFLREKSARETALRKVDGFVIEGFHTNGTTVEDIDFLKTKEILKKVFSLLPEDKPRILHGGFSPDQMIEFIKCGVDLFDSSYVFLLTEDGKASVFPLEGIEDYFHLPEVLSTKKVKYTSVLDLKDSVYKDDFSPISETCACYTCEHYTRAYINHLLVTNELLAPILLMMHNLYHMNMFFKRIQSAISGNFST